MAFTVHRKPLVNPGFTPAATSQARIDPAAFGGGGEGLKAAG